MALGPSGGLSCLHRQQCSHAHRNSPWHGITLRRRTKMHPAYLSRRNIFMWQNFLLAPFDSLKPQGAAWPRTGTSEEIALNSYKETHQKTRIENRLSITGTSTPLLHPLTCLLSPSLFCKPDPSSSAGEALSASQLHGSMTGPLIHGLEGI